MSPIQVSDRLYCSEASHNKKKQVMLNMVTFQERGKEWSTPRDDYCYVSMLEPHRIESVGGRIVLPTICAIVFP